MRELMSNRTMKTKNNANEPMELIPVPSALMSCFLLAQEPRHKQAGIPHRGRWPRRLR
jgi:hypothetical protein